MCEIALADTSHPTRYHKIMQSSLPPRGSETFATVCWRLPVDLNTDRKVLVAKKQLKTRSGVIERADVK